MPDLSRTDRQTHLNKIIGTAPGRLDLMNTYKRAVGMPRESLPPASMSFAQMIDKILDHEYPR